MLTRLIFFGFFPGAGGEAPVVAPVARGGDDVPRHNRLSWNEIARRNERSTVKAYNKLMHIPELKERAEEAVKPFLFKGNLPTANNVDWAAIGQSVELKLRLMLQMRDELIENEEEMALMEILGAIL